MQGYDITIIGAGIVGLATAYQLLDFQPRLKICVVEKEQQVAIHQSSHNSGVIHSGVYYQPGSLRATNCIRGYQMLLDFCDTHEIPYNLCGKLIVATAEKQLPILEHIFQKGKKNGLKGLRFFNKEQIKSHEPYLEGIKAIHVPQAGIISYKEVAEKYAKLIQESGARIRLGENVIKIISKNKLHEIITKNGSILTKVIVSAAGLYSDKVTGLTEVNPNYKILPFRGEYYKLIPSKEYLVNNLIYPVPDPEFPFLGVHFTPMMYGGVEAGPNAVISMKREGYHRNDFNFKEFVEIMTYRGFINIALKYWQKGLGELYRSYSKRAFVRALQDLIPSIRSEDLEVGGAGVRAMACRADGTLLDDYLFIENNRIIHIGNAPSPAATSSLSIGYTVAQKAIRLL